MHIYTYKPTPYKNIVQHSNSRAVLRHVPPVMYRYDYTDIRAALLHTPPVDTPHYSYGTAMKRREEKQEQKIQVKDHPKEKAM